MEKEITIKIISDSKQSDIEICRDAIQALNEKLLMVHQITINDKVIYNVSDGGFTKTN